MQQGVAAAADRVVLDGTELAMLLGGFDVARAQRAAAWEPGVDEKSVPQDQGSLRREKRQGEELRRGSGNLPQLHGPP